MVARINTVAFQGMDVQAVDMQVQISSGLPAFTIVGLPDKAIGKSKERVGAAHAGENPTGLNAHAPVALLEKAVILQEDARALLNQAAESLKLTARSYHRLLRVARTVADLEPQPLETVSKTAVPEAVSYRQTAGVAWLLVKH